MRARVTATIAHGEITRQLRNVFCRLLKRRSSILAIICISRIELEEDVVRVAFSKSSYSFMAHFRPPRQTDGALLWRQRLLE